VKIFHDLSLTKLVRHATRPGGHAVSATMSRQETLERRLRFLSGGRG
jgi:hypothetical protein